MSSHTDRSPFDRLQGLLLRLEDGILVGLLLLMIGIAFTQILLRNLFGAGITWGDTLVRILVLWIGLVGAMVASRAGNHISIDLITRYLSERVRGGVDLVVELFTASVCSVAAYYSLQLILREMEDGTIAFAQVPAWVCQSIIPLAFGVMALRYFMLATKSIQKMVKPTS